MARDFNNFGLHLHTSVSSGTRLGILKVLSKQYICTHRSTTTNTAWSNLKSVKVFVNLVLNEGENAVDGLQGDFIHAEPIKGRQP
jgi:hypothetical protein